MNTLTRKDWTLLVISAAGNDTLTPVQLQKSLFLLKEKVPELTRSDFYEFVPYNYGPFDRKIYTDARLLEQEGDVAMHESPFRNWRVYSVTPKGASRAKELEKQIDQSHATYLRQLVEWVRTRRFEDLLRFIYSKYPTFKINSVFQDTGQ